MSAISSWLAPCSSRDDRTKRGRSRDLMRGGARRRSHCYTKRDDDGKRHRWRSLGGHELPGALKPYSRTVLQTWILYSE